MSNTPTLLREIQHAVDLHCDSLADLEDLWTLLDTLGWKEAGDNDRSLIRNHLRIYGSIRVGMNWKPLPPSNQYSSWEHSYSYWVSPGQWKACPPRGGRTDIPDYPGRTSLCCPIRAGDYAITAREFLDAVAADHLEYNAC